jgi:hypothetical protein
MMIPKNKKKKDTRGSVKYSWEPVSIIAVTAFPSDSNANQISIALSFDPVIV